MTIIYEFNWRQYVSATTYIKLEEENKLLKNEIAWMKDHTKYNGITEEYYIDWTMTATEAKLRLQQAEDYKNYVSKLGEENRKLKNELMEDMKTESKLNEEIRNLKSELSKFRDSFKKYRDYEKEELAESCYDLARENESLKEEINKLEFDIEAWNKLKAVREDKERILNEEIRGLRDKKYSYWEPVVSSWPCFARWNSN